MVTVGVMLSSLVLSFILHGTVEAVGGSAFSYGPAYGVNHDHLLPKNFDDTYAMTQGIGPNEHREMWKISCTHLDGYFIGLQEFYRVPGSNAPNSATSTSYHGWLPIVQFRAYDELYTLGEGDEWDHIVYRYCGRKLTGINFVTKNGGGVSCGNHNYAQPAKNCGGDVLRVPAGRRMIGIYGDANGVKLTSAQGVRGIGMITIAR